MTGPICLIISRSVRHMRLKQGFGAGPSQVTEWYGIPDSTGSSTPRHMRLLRVCHTTCIAPWHLQVVVRFPANHIRLPTSANCYAALAWFSRYVFVVPAQRNCKCRLNVFQPLFYYQDPSQTRPCFKNHSETRIYGTNDETGRTGTKQHATRAFV